MPSPRDLKGAVRLGIYVLRCLYNGTMSARQRLKRIVFTLNNYCEDDFVRIQSYVEIYQYCVVGRETAPETGTPHLQGNESSGRGDPWLLLGYRTLSVGTPGFVAGYTRSLWPVTVHKHTLNLFFIGFINFKSKREFGTIKTIVGDRAHIEPAKGSDVQNKEYCTKGGDYWECGTPSGPGYRSDLADVVQTVKGAKRLREVVERHPCEFIKYHRGIEKLFGMLSEREKRNWKTETIVYYGDPGAGKSRKAAEVGAAAEGGVYYKTRGPWWDGYNGETTVIVDDYYGWLAYDEVLKITDRYL
ncbi:replication-associated protein [Dragonfly associated cyclovirus 3]|uniref:Replication-associated protein n=1 Tax=Dragonfly associated cyclovirus 3 TaxID=1234881 RepID=K0A154_9CIRC|nr:replication-associated protein [Dragonfly associated cyclovirus 3]AFS65285.1 replication-associated protein [Dragonfly associated cyclovirus 3]